MQIQQIFERGLEDHSAGRFREAENLYIQVLSKQPDHADALFRLGILRNQIGSPMEAEDLIRRAISIRPSEAKYVAGLGLVQAGEARFKEAEISFRHAAKLNPDYAEAHNNLGNVLQSTRRSEEAIEAYRRAIATKPCYAEAHSNLGGVLHRTGHLEEAAEQFRIAIASRDNFATAHSNLGNTLREMGRWEEAVAACRRAIELQPDFAEAYCNLGSALRIGMRLDEAEQALRQALRIRPTYPEALSNLAHVHLAQKQFNAALSASRHALAMCPSFALALGNLGNALRELNQIDAAMAAHQKAIEADPDLPAAHYEISITAREQNDPAAAIKSLEHLLELRPENPDVKFTLGYMQLLVGAFDEGWRNFRTRWDIRATEYAKSFERPMWDGSKLNGRRLLIWPEQGSGTNIQFFRYVALLAREGEVVVQAPAALFRLFAGSRTGAEVVELENFRPEFDIHCPMPAIPAIFSTKREVMTFQNILKTVPYISVDSRLIDRWRARMTHVSGSMKVGLTWAGNPLQGDDKNRSFHLKTMSPLAQLKGVHFVSLQKGAGASEAASSRSGLQLTDWTADLKDFAETAALISNLDVVITSDTAVAHVAGALGKPVWVALKYAPDWRWLLDRSDCPWYPTMRLFRQKRRGDWEQVFRDMADVLMNQKMQPC